MVRARRWDGIRGLLTRSSVYAQRRLTRLIRAHRLHSRESLTRSKAACKELIMTARYTRVQSGHGDNLETFM